MSFTIILGNNADFYVYANDLPFMFFSPDDVHAQDFLQPLLLSPNAIYTLDFLQPIFLSPTGIHAAILRPNFVNDSFLVPDLLHTTCVNAKVTFMQIVPWCLIFTEIRSISRMSAKHDSQVAFHMHLSIILILLQFYCYPRDLQLYADCVQYGTKIKCFWDLTLGI